jgi:glycerophosphoryl diester phosphodiesterase
MLALLFSIFSQTPSYGALDTVQNTPSIIAHRGASTEAPENTLSAFKRAIQLGVDFIELDVHLSSDGTPVVMHDPTIERCTNSENPIAIKDCTVSTLKSYDVGSWFSHKYKDERIPTLEEVLCLEKGPVGVMIEIKHEDENKNIHELVRNTLKVIEKCKSLNEGKIILASFSDEVQLIVKKSAPDAIFMPLTCSPRYFYRLIKSKKLEYIGIKNTQITAVMLKDAKKRGKKVWTFTVDKEKQAKLLVYFDIAGIITNDPQKIQKALSKNSRASLQE